MSLRIKVELILRRLQTFFNDRAKLLASFEFFKKEPSPTFISKDAPFTPHNNMLLMKQLRSESRRSCQELAPLEAEIFLKKEAICFGGEDRTAPTWESWFLISFGLREVWKPGIDCSLFECLLKLTRLWKACFPAEPNKARGSEILETTTPAEETRGTRTRDTLSTDHPVEYGANLGNLISDRAIFSCQSIVVFMKEFISSSSSHLDITSAAKAVA